MSGQAFGPPYQKIVRLRRLPAAFFIYFGVPHIAIFCRISFLFCTSVLTRAAEEEIEEDLGLLRSLLRPAARAWTSFEVYPLHPLDI